MRDEELHLNETMFLGAMLKSKDILELSKEMKIKPWFFEEKSNRELYVEAMGIYEQQRFESIAPVILSKQSKFANTFNLVMRSEPEFYLGMYLEDDIPFISIIGDYKAKRRKEEFFSITREIEYKITHDESYAKDVARIDNLRDEVVQADIMNGKDIIHAIDNEIKQEVYKTGIDELDSFLRLEPSTLLVLAGESSSGKTSLANQFVYNFMENYNRTTLYFSLETTQIRLGKRFLRHVQYASDTDREGAKKRINDLGDRIEVTKLCSSMNAIRDNILAKQKTDDRLKFIVVDYLQIVDVDGMPDEKDRVAYVSKQLHMLAQEFGLLVILLCQLRKEEFAKVNGKNTRQEPTMHDLRGSAQIANCADYILINQNEDVTPDDKAKSRKVNIFCVKNKDGSRGKVQLNFYGAAFTFLEKSDKQP